MTLEAGQRLLIARADLHRTRITTDPDNYASQRTCELVGAEYVETVTVPPYDSLYGRGDRTKLRYRLKIDEQD